MMRQVLWTSVVGLLLVGPGCDSPKSDEPIASTKKPGELKQAVDDTKSAEELEKARREAGLDPDAFDKAAAENIAEMEKGEREYIKRRLDKYREMMKRIRELVDGVEKAAKSWPKDKDPQASFEKFAETYKEDMKTFLEGYNELTENGIRGGNAQAKMSKALRAWESLNDELSPTVATEGNLDTALTELRAELDEVDKELDAIEKDATLDASGDEDDGAEGDAKADDAKADDAKAG